MKMPQLMIETGVQLHLLRFKGAHKAELFKWQKPKLLVV